MIIAENAQSRQESFTAGERPSLSLAVRGREIRVTPDALKPCARMVSGQRTVGSASLLLSLETFSV